MSQPIQRDGVWWHQKADDTWLRWNAQKSEWETAPAAPPPPAPPQGDGPETALNAESFGFSTSESGAPSSSGGPEASVEVKWDFGDEGGAPINLGPANADVLPPESGKPSASDWLNANRAVAALIAVILLAAAAFAGVTFLGGDDDPGAGGIADGAIGAPISKKAAVRKLDALCSSAKSRMNALGNPTSTDEFVVFLDKAGNEFKAIVQELGRVRPAPKHKADFSRIVQDFQKSISYAGEAKAAAESGNLVGLQQTLVEMDAFSTKMRSRARAFGANACATT